MADELAAAHTFIETLLAADTTLTGLVGTNIYADDLPEGTTASPTPRDYVLYNLQSAVDERNIQGDVVYAVFVFHLQAVSARGYPILSAIVERLNAALVGQNNVSVTVSGVNYNLKCTRDRLHQHRPHLENGVLYRTRGLIVRIMAEVVT